MSNKWQEMYRQKLCRADDCVKLLRDGDAIFYPLANGAPVAIGDAIGKRMREDGLKDLLLSCGVDIKWSDIFHPENSKQIIIDCGFVGEVTRRGIHEGWYTYATNRLGQSVRITADELPGVARGAVACVVSPMDEHGWFSTGIGTDIAYGAWRTDKFRELFVEVNENMPRTYGANHFHISEVSCVVENNMPLVELPEIPMSKEDEMIGQYIAELVPDGACIQIGIGGMPNAVAKYLHGKKDLGVHSEMLTDSMVDLFEDGVITCARKNLHRYKMIGSFALGSKKLYDFVESNPFVEIHCASYVNDPNVIGLNDNLISVNGTIEVDITGQAVSESIGHKQYSGTGGQLDFIQGAWRSKGGKSFLATYSTYKDKDGNLQSSIKPMLTSGAYVTAPRSEVDNIVTEYGIAHMKGWHARQRVKNMISIAHPDFRDELTFEARKMNLIP